MANQVKKLKIDAGSLEDSILNENNIVGKYRKRKYLSYDSDNNKFKVVGTDATPISSTSDLQIFNFVIDGVTYIIRGAAGAELELGSIEGNMAFGVAKDIADPSNIELSDILFISDSSAQLDTNFIKIGHLTYGAGLTSRWIIDYKDWDSQVKAHESHANTLKLANDFSYNTKILWRKRKWIAWDRSNRKLIVVGSDSAQSSDSQIVRFIHDGIAYYIHGLVGTSQSLALTSGNSQIMLPKDVTDPNNVLLSDFVVFNDAIDRSSTHIKLAHITYNDGLTSELIIDYEDYNNKKVSSSISTLLGPSSFINNSIGENNFAHGIRSELKILAFGNSYMRNSCYYLSSISNGLGVNLTVGNLYTGGTKLSHHLAALRNNSDPYEWHKYENGVNTENQYSQTAKRGLLDERWDVVILHQYRPWEEPFEPNLNLVIAEIVKILGYCPKFYMNATWATHKDYVLAQTDFSTELEHWQYELTANQNACIDSGIIQNSIIPIGTAIQNARTLAFADDYFRFTNSGGDWHHLNCAGGFIAACTIYEKIIYPLNKIHCSNTTFRIPIAQQLPPGNVPVESNVIVTDSNYLGMCQSAIDAVTSPDAITSQ